MEFIQNQELDIIKFNNNLKVLYEENLDILKNILMRDDKLKNIENSSYTLKESSLKFYEETRRIKNKYKNSYNYNYFFICMIIMILLFILIKLVNYRKTRCYQRNFFTEENEIFSISRIATLKNKVF